MGENYTYLIGWSRLNVWYYGVQYNPMANKNDLWTTYLPDTFTKQHRANISNAAKLGWEKRRARMHGKLFF